VFARRRGGHDHLRQYGLVVWHVQEEGAEAAAHQQDEIDQRLQLVRRVRQRRVPRLAGVVLEDRHLSL